MAAAAAIAFLGGLLAGSFVTVVAHRVPRGESIVGPRSRCPACGAQIAAYDNVPVVSWVLLRGQGALLRSGDLGALPAHRAGARRPLRGDRRWSSGTSPGEVALGLVFVTMLVAVTLTDLELRIIPNKILIVAAVARRGDRRGRRPGQPARAGDRRRRGRRPALRGALAYPRGMGLGDVKLAAMMGLFLGRNVAPAIFVALLAGSLVGLAMIARDGAAARKRAIPFGPFLALGGVVGLLAGDQMVDWYLSTF